MTASGKRWRHGRKGLLSILSGSHGGFCVVVRFVAEGPELESRKVLNMDGEEREGAFDQQTANI
jgi:hypothetical protein